MKIPSVCLTIAVNILISLVHMTSFSFDDSRSMKKAPLVVQNLLLLLPMVRQADLDIKNFFKSVQQNQQGNVKLNKLLVEMLEHA